MEAAVGVIAAVMTMSQAYSQHQKSTEQGRQTLDQGELLEGRDRFTKQINGEFEEISLQTNIIREIDSHLTKLEQRITTIFRCSNFVK